MKSNRNANMPDLELDSNWLKRFRGSVRRWYVRHARVLPWRGTADPYRIWISEIMLQQTTVAAVIGYFERFLARFPTLETLAAAPEDDVLRSWEGLGYYSRARNIHKTAKLLVHDHGGRFPDVASTLVQLPGIGRYTAGAIASFAFDRRAPIVEANTLRFYSRLLGYEGDPRSTEGQRLLWDFAERVLPCHSPGRFNQALMELGATVCTPVTPKCRECPVRSCCRAFAIGKQGEIPRAAARPGITAVTEAAVAVRKGNAYLLRRRGPQERWAGLWDFLRYPVESNDADDRSVDFSPRGARAAERASRGNSRNRRNGRSSRSSKNNTNGQPSGTSAESLRMLESRIAVQTGLVVGIGALLTELHHSVTRYRIRLLCLSAAYRSGTLVDGAELRWVHPAKFNEYPLSVTGRKFACLLTVLAGGQRPPER